VYHITSGAYFGLGNLWGEMDSSDPYLLVKNMSGDVIHKTEYVPKNLNPKWETFDLPLERLCFGHVSGALHADTQQCVRATKQYVRATSTVWPDRFGMSRKEQRLCGGRRVLACRDGAGDRVLGL
jgi:hypothetical protein